VAAADMYMIVGGAGLKNGTDWDNAFSIAEFETDVEGGAEAGDRYFVMEGTYTLTSAINTLRDGSSAEPIYIIGVKSGTSAEPPTTADWAEGAARPLFTNAANHSFTVDNWWQMFNIRMVSDDSTGTCRMDTGCVVENCYYENTSTGYAFLPGAGGASIVGCEFISDGGIALSLTNTCRAISSYIHDSVTGVALAGNSALVNCVVDTCTTGINIASNDFTIMSNNTIYDCTTGITGTDPLYLLVVNNIIDACTLGITWTTNPQKTNWVDYNCYDNADDETNVPPGRHAVIADPEMAGPDGGDFTLDAGSPALAAAIDAGTNSPATL